MWSNPPSLLRNATVLFRLDRARMRSSRKLTSLVVSRGPSSTQSLSTASKALIGISLFSPGLSLPLSTIFFPASTIFAPARSFAHFRRTSGRPYRARAMLRALLANVASTARNRALMALSCSSTASSWSSFCNHRATPSSGVSVSQQSTTHTARAGSEPCPPMKDSAWAHSRLTPSSPSWAISSPRTSAHGCSVPTVASGSTSRRAS
mmetsp:Transcript_97671/g.260716  ORF Transcript_97671/g.260716 Transcript_97671/m.260716 type:complete len:207 (-) Transcript_97671:218-838(-)